MHHIALSTFNYVSHCLNCFWKNSNAKLFGLFLLSYANYAYAQAQNPYVTGICNFVNLFSTPLITGITFIATAVLVILVMVTEAKGVIGQALKILICAMTLLTLKSLITTLTGYSFGC